MHKVYVPCSLGFHQIICNNNCLFDVYIRHAVGIHYLNRDLAFNIVCWSYFITVIFALFGRFEIMLAKLYKVFINLLICHFFNFCGQNSWYFIHTFIHRFSKWNIFIFCSHVFSQVFSSQNSWYFIHRLFHRFIQRFSKWNPFIFCSYVFSQVLKFTGFFTGCFCVTCYFTGSS